MPNISNLNAEIGANYIGDDAQPAITLYNTSTGPGLRVMGFVATSTASIDIAYLPTIRSGATEGVPLSLSRDVVSSPTVAVIALNIGSTASAAVIELQAQGFVSCTTILFTTGATAGVGAIRVKYGDNYGWIPVLPGGSVTATPRG